MINVWNYVDAGRVRITDVDGDVLDGIVAEITDEGERSDLERQEDGITIMTDDRRLVAFYQSEIKTVEVLG